ncbi:hypothetical protein F4678DRAFT_416597 [Xylaria arbuscula]|nr:hypothetical protein F4678DRAFT_416597 [Xylaria arbuscula]
MSRYGRVATSEGEFSVNVDGFSYITAEDLEHSLQPPERFYDPHHRQISRSEDDDVLLLKYRSVTYPITFGAGSISDAQVTLKDVRDRAEMEIDFPINHAANLLRILYKSREIMGFDVPVREYGVTNNSELVLVLPEHPIPHDDERRVEEIEDSSRAPKRTYSTTYHMRKSVPQSLKPLQRPVKSKTTLAHVDFMTISRDSTGDENLRNSASFAFLGSKLKRKRPAITITDLYSDGRERSRPRFIEEEREEMAEKKALYDGTPGNNILSRAAELMKGAHHNRH